MISLKLSDYIQSIKNKRIAVVGIGVSNTPLIEHLLADGCTVTACDKSDRAKLGGLAETLEARGAVLRLGEDYLKDLDADIVFRTPGMRPDLPELQAAIAHGAVLTSEMEVFFDVCPCPIIGVTGSDGKTTTTSIIAKLLEAEGATVHLGGNIGTPLLTRADAMKETDVAVLELSSFQLMTMTKSPHIAVVTNVTPNHLDMHLNLGEYIEAKRNILRFQSSGDIAVLNLDNEVARGFAPAAPGEVRFFSLKNSVGNGVFLDDGALVEAFGGTKTQVMKASDIRLRGAHNTENYMAACAAVRGFVSHATFRRVAMEFGGVAHRCELVRTLRGVSYYNDSIASSPTRTIAGLRAFDRKVILIAGGKDKGIEYDALGPEIVAHVKTLVVTGATAEKIKTSVLNDDNYHGVPEIIEKDDFKEAVLAAHNAAADGDIVVLSPASTSFDRFRNFEERGNTFKDIVNGLL